MTHLNNTSTYQLLLMHLPTQPQITELYQRYHTPLHIVDHMVMVDRIATWLAEQRKKQGDQVDIELTSVAARLHDLVRLPQQWSYLPAGITTPLPHAEINYFILRNDFPEVAEIIRVHSLMTILQPNAFASLEQKIVYYADKRANHSSIVSLQDRLQLGQSRWQVTPEQDHSAELLTKLTQLETELFQHLTIHPNDLHAVISFVPTSGGSS